MNTIAMSGCWCSNPFDAEPSSKDYGFDSIKNSSVLVITKVLLLCADKNVPALSLPNTLTYWHHFILSGKWKIGVVELYFVANELFNLPDILTKAYQENERECWTLLQHRAIALLLSSVQRNFIESNPLNGL
ncbi:hypothetical protein Tco_0228087 [Tanacetum coccineum]